MTFDADADESAAAAVALPATVTPAVTNATSTDRAMRVRMGFSLAYGLLGHHHLRERDL